MSDHATALVAGVNGFIGAALARRLKAAGWRVVGLLRSGSNWDRLAETPGLELIEVANYTTEELKRALAKVTIDVVYQLAASGVTPGANDLIELTRGNALLVENLLEALADRRIRRFIHVGSCSEYAPGVIGVPMDESWPQEPASPYGLAKLTATHWARIHAERLGLPLTVLRLFGVYGPGEAPHRLLPAIVNGLATGHGTDLTPGLQQRDWLFVDDAADALITAASADDLGPVGAIYNVCTGQPASVRDVGETVCAILGAPPDLLRWGALPYRAGEPMWVVGDATRFCERTGWRPHWTWPAGVQKTLETKLHSHAHAA